MMADTAADRAAIAAVHNAFVAADLAGDAEAMQRLLTEDVVILHPVCGVIEGRESAGLFIRQVLGELHTAFRRQASYSTYELRISGDLAYERGHLSQILTPLGEGSVDRDEGMYLWIYVRDAEQGWRIARIAGTLAHQEPEMEQTP